MEGDPVYSTRIPKYWLSCPKHGELIQAPNDPNLKFFPCKTPVPMIYKDIMDSNAEWTVQKIIEAIREQLNGDNTTLLYHIDVSRIQDELLGEEWEKLSVRHYSNPIPENYSRGSAQSFSQIVEQCRIPNYKSVVIVTCTNGFDRTGFSIIGYLCSYGNLDLKSSIETFKKAREPGIISTNANDQLGYLKVDDPYSKSVKSPKPPAWMDSTHYEMDEVEIPNLYDSSFRHFGGEKVNDADILSDYNEIINKNVGEGFDSTSKGRIPSPKIEVWNDDTLDLIKRHAFRCTYQPRGTDVFIFATNPEFFIIAFTNRQYFRFEATVKCQLPFICTGIALDTKSRNKILLTDVLLYEGKQIDKLDYDNRLSILWYEILPNISRYTHKDGIKLLFRAAGRVTDAVKINNLSKDMQLSNGVRCSGLAFIARKAPVGRYFVVPSKPHLKLYFVYNAKDRAVLYARADDGMSLVPFYIFTFDDSRKTKYSALHQNVVMFKLDKNHFKPVTLCINGLADFISYAKAVKDFSSKRLDIEALAHECEEAALNQAANQVNIKKHVA